MRVAIQPDNYTNPHTPEKADASSPRWAEAVQRAGHEVCWVNVYRPDIVAQLKGCQGFMWRWAHFGGMAPIARRLWPVLERELDLLVYPDYSTCWHYDDKIAQAHLLAALGLPAPRTWVWYDGPEAQAWARQASYPLVLKLATGAGAANVCLVRNADEAQAWIAQLCGRGVYDLDPANLQPWAWKRRFRAAAKALLRGQPLTERLPVERERQQGYALFQEFLPDNAFDTRVTVIGPRAFGFRRFNREGDFRASGSGKLDWDMAAVDPRFLQLAFRVAEATQAQSVAIDGLYRGTEVVVGEISYTYASWAVHQCPGHWDKDLNWRPGPMWPEEAQAADFLARLEARRGGHV